jgi:hypothetical protein
MPTIHGLDGMIAGYHAQKEAGKVEPLLKADAPDRHVHVCDYVEDGRIVPVHTGQLLIFVNADWEWEMNVWPVIKITQVRYCLGCGKELGEVVR